MSSENTTQFSRSQQYHGRNRYLNEIIQPIPDYQRPRKPKSECVNMIEIFKWSPLVARFRITKQPTNCTSASIKVILGNDLDYDKLEVRKISHNVFQVQKV